MRVLLMATPVPTHLTPMLPLAGALRRAGHGVLVASQPNMSPVARAAGLDMVEVGEPFAAPPVGSGRPDGASHKPGGPLPPAANGDDRPAGGHRAVHGIEPVVSTFARHADSMLGHYLELARRYRPDLVLADCLEYSALLVGAVLRVPVVAHRWGADPFGLAGHEMARQALDALSTAHGVAGGLPEPTLRLDPCPPSLRVPGGPPATGIRPVPAGRTGATVPPGAGQYRICGWFDAGPAPRVAGLVRALAAATRHDPAAEVVISAPDRALAAVGPLPDRIRVFSGPPDVGVLTGCAALVDDGAPGPALAALACGVPQLVLPAKVGPRTHGVRTAVVGAGITLEDPTSQQDPARLRHAIRHLRTDSQYTVGARQLRDEVAAMPTPDDIVGTLRRLGVEAQAAEPASAGRGTRAATTPGA